MRILFSDVVAEAFTLSVVDPAGVGMRNDGITELDMKKKLKVITNVKCNHSCLRPVYTEIPRTFSDPLTRLGFPLQVFHMNTLLRKTCHVTQVGKSHHRDSCLALPVLHSLNAGQDIRDRLLRAHRY